MPISSSTRDPLSTRPRGGGLCPGWSRYRYGLSLPRLSRVCRSGRCSQLRFSFFGGSHTLLCYFFVQCAGGSSKPSQLVSCLGGGDLGLSRTGSLTRLKGWVDRSGLGAWFLVCQYPSQPSKDTYLGSERTSKVLCLAG